MSARALRDLLARLTRAREALADGEGVLAEQLLDDLAHDVWRLVEEIERGTA